VKLGQLVSGADPALADRIVTGFAIDHRKIASGTVFGAFAGAAFNGEDFIDAAIAAGAVAVVARPEATVQGAVHVADANPRKAFAELAAKFFRPFPENVAAVTGTNGKTSTAELTRQLWRMSGHDAASIGTLGITTASDQASTGLTTPDIVTFLANMSGLAREGISHAIFEASSHGLSQYRSEGVPVSVAAFTNLSRDHLDYHGTMENYFETKMRLFDQVVEANGCAVIWADDIWSDQVIARARQRELRLITVGEKGKGIQLISRQATQLGQTLELRIQGDVHKVKLPLIGAYQAANALVAAGVVMASAVAASARTTGACRHYQKWRACVCRLCAYARRLARGHCSIAPAYEGQVDYCVRRRRRPRYRQASGDGRCGRRGL
jgi:UDP-N-acetylmuramoyl-L-alanyl-D-glutamate--2,6-diaminopimelate ligase